MARPLGTHKPTRHSGSLVRQSKLLQSLAALSLLTVTSVVVFASLYVPRGLLGDDDYYAAKMDAPSFGESAAPAHAAMLAAAIESSLARNASDVITEEEARSATVLAFAMNYGVGTHRRYVGSLRKQGFKGNIILGIEANPRPGVLDYLSSQNVVVKKLTFGSCTWVNETNTDEGGSHSRKELKTCAARYPNIKVRWSRFPLIRDFLSECSYCTGPVLISDYRDVLFQRNPFAVGEPAIRGLQVFEEHRSIKTTHWLVQWPVKACKGVEFNEPMLCSGSTIGDRPSMLAYLNEMYAEMKVWMADPKCHFGVNGDDQSMHNYLFYSGRLPYAKKIPFRRGIVHTVGAQGAIIKKAHRGQLLKEKKMDQRAADLEPLIGADGNGKDGGAWLGLHMDLTDKEGYFVNMDGTRSHVIHQYDRFGAHFERWVQKQEGQLYN